mmetsp:Transcript_18543/g.28026  ORF Transcript_18543/g.28026 Transcript_18543/m.28026 type:complete len:368 (-) Transcript_18543:339-1442(-)
MLRNEKRNAALFLGILLLLKDVETLSLSEFFSRSRFLSLVRSSPFASNLLFKIDSSSPNDDDSVKLPLRFLPISGCWALNVILSDEEERDINYYAVIDSGSPFLTAPSAAMDVTMKTGYPSSQEQYGESTGEIAWQRAPYLTILGDSVIMESKDFVVGIVTSQEVLEQSGGFFLGLMEVDDNRPSFLQQVRQGLYSSFTISFSQNYLQLRQGSAIPKGDADSFALVDLKPYGPDLHHFAIDCQEIELVWSDAGVDMVPVTQLSRPTFVVLDTGLTGCIFSESLYRELKQGDDTFLTGLTVSLRTQSKHTMKLSSSKAHWNFSSFQLPWFFNDKEHPHIIALGCTFWENTKELTIDTLSRRAKIVLRE